MLIPGTKIRVEFYTFEGVYPPLYYAANEGSLNLASVNAGNSDGLCVGLGGVNGGFLLALTAAGQKNANLNQCSAQGALDDYQSRHLKLLAKANGGVAHESYANTDPCAFSYVNASQVSKFPGWFEGVCFVDVFDPAHCPEGNSKNVAMLYVAPPNGRNYRSDAAFLAAIQATAGNALRAVAGYNAIAAQYKQPVIEAVRGTLFSSVIYNPNSVPHDDIARAIYAGFAAELKNTPNSGLLEIQFPVADPLFWAVQTDASKQPPAGAAVAAAAAAPVMMLFEAGDGGVEVDDPVENEPDFDVASGEDAVAIGKTLDFGARSTAAEANMVKNLADSLISQLKSGGALKPADPVRHVTTSPDFTTEPIVKTAPKGKGDEPVKRTQEYANATQLRAIRAQAPAEQAYGESSFSRIHENEGNGGGGNGKGGGGGGQYGPFPKLPEVVITRGKGFNFGAKAWILIGIGGILAWSFDTAVATLIAFAAGGFKKKSKLALAQPADLPAPSANDQSVTVQATVTDGETGTLLDSGSVTFSVTTSATPPVAVGTAVTIDVDAKGVATGSVTIPANTATGSYVLTATYSGTFSGLVYGESSDQKNVGVGAVTQVDTATTIAAPATDGGSFAEGSTLTVTASVTANATGTVSFSLSSTPPVTGSATLDSTGKASTTITLPSTPGSYKLTATYGGDTTHKTSGAERTIQVVAAATPTITESPADAWIVTGGEVTLTAAATPTTATVQWEISTDGGKTFTGIAGATSLALIAQTAGQYRAVFTDAGVSATTKAATLTVSPVVYLGPDTTSQGDWTAKYGAELFRIAAVPPVAVPSPIGTITVPMDTFSYAVSSGAKPADPRELATTRVAPPNPNTTSYIAAAIVPPAGKNSFELTVTANDGKPHRIALYMVDWERTSKRIQTITFSDVTGATKYDTRTFANFEDGVYGLWNFSGSVKITVAETGANPVLFGVFIDAAHTAADFRLDAAATTVTLGGGTVKLPVPAFPANGFHGAVKLAASNWPAGIAAAFDTNDPLTVTITVDNTVKEGRYSLPVIATSGALTTTTTVLLGVNPPGKPQMRHILLAADVTTGQAGAVDVLARGDSFYDKDPKSVILTGMQDSGGSTAAPMALVATDGKSLRVDGEGVWLVDQNGFVAFIGDPGLDHPPTPVAVCFSDVKGNQSNNALIVIDPNLDQVGSGLKAVNKMDDAAFWKRFQTVMIDDPAQDLDLDTIVVALTGMVQTTGLAASTGPRNPVHEADFDAAYRKWLASKSSLRSLKSICAALVDNALPKPPAPPLRARFWTLLSMLQMAQKALGIDNDV